MTAVASEWTWNNCWTQETLFCLNRGWQRQPAVLFLWMSEQWNIDSSPDQADLSLCFSVCQRTRCVLSGAALWPVVTPEAPGHNLLAWCATLRQNGSSSHAPSFSMSEWTESKLCGEEPSGHKVQRFTIPLKHRAESLRHYSNRFSKTWCRRCVCFEAKSVAIFLARVQTAPSSGNIRKLLFTTIFRSRSNFIVWLTSLV